MEMRKNSDKTPCGFVDEADSAFEGQLINSIVNCLEAEHERFGEPLMRLAAAAATLAPEPLNPELRANAMDAWARLKTDLWSHIEREDALIFSCRGLSAEFIE